MEITLNKTKRKRNRIKLHNLTYLGAKVLKTLLVNFIFCIINLEKKMGGGESITSAKVKYKKNKNILLI